MDRPAGESTQKPQREIQTVRRFGKRAVIASAFGFAVALAAAAVAAGLAVHRSPPAEARDDGCARTAANDSRALFEAFFQNPVERNALAQIADVCRK